MQNYHYSMAKTIISESSQRDEVTGVEPTELAKAQVHATLALADAVSAVTEAILRTRQG
jgi:hypothetical protein